MLRAASYLTQHGYPPSTPIERVAEGAESAQFKAEFFQWDPPRPLTFDPRPSNGVASAKSDSQVHGLVWSHLNSSRLTLGHSSALSPLRNNFSMMVLENSKYGESKISRGFLLTPNCKNNFSVWSFFLVTVNSSEVTATSFFIPTKRMVSKSLLFTFGRSGYLCDHFIMISG
jgi:hypothetical protein